MAVPEIPKTPATEEDWFTRDWIKYFQGLKDHLLDIHRWVLKTAAYTATNSERILADTATTAAFTVTLLASPKTGWTVYFHDPNGNWATDNLTLDGNGKNVMGASTLVLSTNNDTLGVVYSGSEWRRLY